MHSDPVSQIIFWFTILLTCGVFGRFVAVIFHQPRVLGELLMGILVGNLLYFFDVPMALILREGASALKGSLSTESDKVAYMLDNLSRLGIIFLLFMVGLETSISELKQTGREASMVAVIGVILPMLFGFIFMRRLMPAASIHTDLFVAATLSATSVGITARVLKEMNKTRSREAKIILGAAMIDDILGLIVLSMVSSLVIHDAIHLCGVLKTLAGVMIFFVIVVGVGPWVVRQAIKIFSFLDYWEAKLLIAFIFLMALAWGAALVQLSTIIGAFAAGMILHDGFFEKHRAAKNMFDEKKVHLHTVMAPLEALLAPLFFVLMGMQVKLETLMSTPVFTIAVGLLLAAIFGKLLSGLGASQKSDRLLIGIGMLPRGEVGLVFASVGRSLGVVPDEIFSAIVMMIMVTTVMVPVWLKSRFSAIHQ